MELVIVQRKVTGPDEPPVIVMVETGLLVELTVTPPLLPVHKPVSLIPGEFADKDAEAPGQ